MLLFPCTFFKVLQLNNTSSFEAVITTIKTFMIKSLLSSNKDICGGGMETHFRKPFNSHLPIFLLFDTVHLLKNIRNNWINQYSKTIIYPSFKDHSKINTCDFHDVINLYESEKLPSIKLVSGLSYKVYYPYSMEPQNVKVFDEKTVAAININGTKELLGIIHQWWITVNVKHPEKGKRLGDFHANPVYNLTQAHRQILNN